MVIDLEAPMKNHAVLEWVDFFSAFHLAIFRYQKPNSRDSGCWRSFLDQFKTLHFDQWVKPTPLSIVTADNYAKFISAFKVPFSEHYEKGHGINVWNVAGLYRDEVRNSAVLAWLLDRNGSHGKGSLFLEDILTMVRNDPDTPILARDKLPTIEDLKKYRTKVESLPLGDTASRVDIEIEGGGSIFIEVKINASETNNQLKRYIELAKYKGNGKWAVLFLTKRKSRPLDTMLYDEVISISWKEVAKSINKNLEEDSFSNTIIRQFCKHIHSF